MIRILALSFTVLLSASALAKDNKQFKISPLGNLKAPVKGLLVRNLISEPESFNPVNSQELVSQFVFQYVTDSLLTLGSESYELEPSLADKYEVYKDGLTLTFHLREGLVFSDGSPLTSDDVKFTFEYPKDLAYKAAARMPYYEDVDHVETPDPRTVVVKMKRKYYLSLQNLGTTGILSRKTYGDPKKDWPDNPLYGSGPYKVEVYNRGKNIMLVRNPSWFGYKIKELDGQNKFERINFRFIKEDNLAIDMAKRGDIDYLDDIRAENFVKKAVGEPIGTKIAKYQVENKAPKWLSFVAWNERNPLFKDRDVRMALAELLNRKELINKFYYGLATEAKGPFSYNSPFMSPDVQPVQYNPEGAKALLKKAGWEDKEHNGILQKTIDGKKVEFRFDLLLPTREVEKFFTLYKEDLRKAGIEMNIKLIEWSTFSKLLDEQKFDAVTLRWGAGNLEDDLKQIWHSDSARPGGSNFAGYANKEVDKLIDQARGEMNKEKRKNLWRKVSKLIADDQPYAFMFNNKYELYLLNKKIATPKPTFAYGVPFMYFYTATP